MATVVNPITGVEYDEVTGNSIKLYVPVSNGQVLNPNGVRWPYNEGGVHKEPADYYERVPHTSTPFDPELFVVDSLESGWELKPATGNVPDGHPKGTYEYKETIKRRSIAELKVLAKGYADRHNSQLWPQENGYAEKLAYAKEQIAKNNREEQYLNLVERHEKLIAASFHNDARLAQLYAEIEAAGENGPIDFVVNQMATQESKEGWVNGIE
jgi:hypothetical protein